MTKEIAPGLRYIGVQDKDIDLFESQYAVPEGMSYNSYLILDEKVAVLDTADARKAEEWKRNLTEALEGRLPDYLVIHHMEPDHSALIREALEAWPGLRLVTTAKAARMLEQFFDGFDFSGRVQTVKEGDILPLGVRSLQFVEAPMVHWPEVMVSYDAASKTLFSADAFGKFGTLDKAFYGDEEEDWACEARRYYFNICGKYGAPVQQLLRKAAVLDIRTICPLHGPVLRRDLGQYLDLYQTWSTYGVESEGVFIAYASIHGGTAAVAKEMAAILKEKGCPKVALNDLSRDDQAEGVEDAFRYGRVIFAAATYDGGLFPPMEAFLHHLRDKAWQKRRVGLIENGSWAPVAGRHMRDLLGAMKDIDIVAPTVTIRSRMKAADRPALEDLADAILR